MAAGLTRFNIKVFRVSQPFKVENGCCEGTKSLIYEDGIPVALRLCSKFFPTQQSFMEFNRQLHLTRKFKPTIYEKAIFNVDRSSLSLPWVRSPR
jgi:hypothetical protein